MKHFYAFIFSLLTVLPAMSQSRGNEWIDYSQKYIKIKVQVDGIYRIDSTTLSNAIAPTGYSLTSIDPRNFQLFANGAEQYIWVQGEGDGVFNSGDFIEFIGRRNDGTLDSELYANSQHLNPYFSLYTDTTVYFLTWNSSINNRRFTAPADTAFSSYTASSYFTDLEKFGGGQVFLPGQSDPSGITDPDFIDGEGYYYYDVGYASPQTFAMNSQFAYTAGPAAIARLRIGTHSNDWTIGNDNDVRITYPTSVYDTIYDGFGVGTYSDTFPASSLGATSTNITVENVNIFGSVSSGRIALSWITLQYPHTFNMESRTLFRGYLPDNTSQSKSLVRMYNMGGSGNVRYYDLYNHERIDGVLNGGYYDFLVSNGNGSEKEFVATMDGNAIAVTNITPVNSNGSFTDFALLQADSAFVIVSTPRLWSVATDYQNYRSSLAGGSRNVVMADVWELYDQFAYGQTYNPLAIRHFCGFMMDTFPTAPAHLLLLGKSIEGSTSRAGWMGLNLVPTMGYPASDNLITSGLLVPGQWSSIPTGRIAAQDSASARWYLNKVIEYENNQPAEWMKHVLHFAGGSTPGEQQQFRGYLRGYQNIIEDTLFGAYVDKIHKNTSQPIQINQSDTLREWIETGVSIMTFFGHASGTGFDQSIDDPQNYNNFDRYPLLIANSCYAGDIHTTGISSSESFTLIDQKGTIGYIASVSLGSPPFLATYTSNLYEGIADALYGRSIGECIQYATDQSQVQVGIPLMRYTALEMTYQGDPAVVINSFDKPDYVITTPDIFFDITSQPDSITVFAVATNIGKAIADTIVVRMEREFPNGELDTFYLQVAAPKFKDTIQWTIPLDIQRAVGINNFTVWLDFFNEADEFNEANNQNIPAAPLVILGSAIIPVYPYNFAVIPTDTITLKASTVNPMEPYRAWRFEIDTTDLFNSPFKISMQVYDSGGVVSWHPNLTFPDSAVYFWRVSPDSLTPSDALIWKMHSFQYINGQTGWGQDHIYQFTNDGYQFVNLNRQNRDFEFVDDIKEITVKDGVYGFPSIVWNEVWYKLNGATQHIFSCTPAFGLGGVSIAVIDQISGLPYSHGDDSLLQYPNGVLNCVPSNPIQYLYAFDFTDVDQTNRDYIRDFIDSIPNGRYVLVYSQYLHKNMQYDGNLLSSLQSIGVNPAGLIGSGSVQDTLPWIAWGIKGGAANSATEVVGTVGNQYIYLTDTFQTNWNGGFVASPPIGPAQSWGSLHWKQHEVETPDYDSVYLEVQGIDVNGATWHLFDLDEDSTDIINLSSRILANQYPYIRLIAHMKDDTSRTPPQLDRWHVLFTPWPDAAVNPQLAYSFYSDTLQEGDTARFVIGVENVTPWAFTDSLLISSWIIDENRVRHDLPDMLRAPSFNGNTWYSQAINVSTERYAGHNELWVEINQLGNSNTQPEYQHFNNVIMTPFYVGTDRINPLLDVTFDGVHILDGDIVSGKPSVLITLKDENQFLALNDTADFKVFVKSPSQTVAQLIPWGPEMIFTPAQLPNNSCKILYTPTLLEDGIYELIVQAKDRSDNESGLIDYNISFEVINKSTITNVLNYPNPFSTSTRFVFTLTGNEVPDVFTIQIMTITGKVVREIDRDELGNIHVGRNVTDYAWDGMDEFGDPLANGVYLYRVITRMNGEAIEQRQSGADPYIINGWGKMYLMR